MSSEFTPPNRNLHIGPNRILLAVGAALYGLGILTGANKDAILHNPLVSSPVIGTVDLGAVVNSATARVRELTNPGASTRALDLPTTVACESIAMEKSNPGVDQAYIAKAEKSGIKVTTVSPDRLVGAENVQALEDSGARVASRLAIACAK